MVERIGLQGVMDTTQFKTGKDAYTRGIKEMQDATKAAASQMGRGLADVGNQTLSVGNIIKGFLGIKAVQIGIGFAKDTLKQAWNAVAAYEGMSMSMSSLIANEIRQESVQTETIKTGQVKVALTQKETEKLGDLTAKLAKNNASLAVQEERYQKAAESGKKSAAELELMRINLDQARQRSDEYSGAIAVLNAKQGALVDTTQTVKTYTMTQEEAMAKAGDKAKEMLHWIEKLAIISPFDQKGVAQAFRTALAYGFTTKESQRLTESMINFASASGQDVSAMNRIALALGQIKAKGKLAGQEVLQLVNAGIPVRQILADGLGVTTMELEKMQKAGLAADKVIEIIVSSLEERFGGAAEAGASTLSGLANSLSDLKEVVLRDVFKGIFDQIRPYMVKLVNTLTSEEVREGIVKFGENVGKVAAGIVGSFSGVFDTIEGLVRAGPDLVKGLGAVFSAPGKGGGTEPWMKAIVVLQDALRKMGLSSEQVYKVSAFFGQAARTLQPVTDLIIRVASGIKSGFMVISGAIQYTIGVITGKDIVKPFQKFMDGMKGLTDKEGMQQGIKWLWTIPVKFKELSARIQTVFATLGQAFGAVASFMKLITSGTIMGRGKSEMALDFFSRLQKLGLPPGLAQGLMIFGERFATFTVLITGAFKKFVTGAVTKGLQVLSLIGQVIVGVFKVFRMTPESSAKQAHDAMSSVVRPMKELGASSVVINAVFQIIGKIKDVFRGIGEAIISFVNGPLLSAIPTMWEAIKTVGAIISYIFSNIVGYSTQKVDTIALQEQMGGITEMLARLGLSGPVIDTAVQVIEKIRNTLGALSEIAEGLLSMATGGDAEGYKGIDAVTEGLYRLGASEEVVNTALGILSSIGNILPTISGFIGKAVPVIVDKMKALLSFEWNTFKTVMGVGGQAILDLVNVWSKVLSGDWKGAWEAIKTFFGNVLKGIGQIGSQIIKGIIDIFVPKNIQKGIGDKFKNIDLADLINNWVRTGIANLLRYLSIGVGLLANFLGDLVRGSAQAASGEKSLLQKIGEVLWGIIKGAFQGLNDAAPDIMHMLGNLLGLAIRLLITIVGTLAKLLVTAIKSIFIQGAQRTQDDNLDIVKKITDMAWSFFTGMMEVIVGPDKIAELKGKIKGLGENIAVGLVEGIEGKAAEIIRRVTEWVTSVIPEPIRRALGMESPSKVMIAIGYDAMKGLTIGIEGGGKDAAKAAVDITSKIIGSLNTLVKAIKRMSVGTQAMPDFSAWATGFSATLEGMATAVSNALRVLSPKGKVGDAKKLVELLGQMVEPIGALVEAVVMLRAAPKIGNVDAWRDSFIATIMMVSSVINDAFSRLGADAVDKAQRLADDFKKILSWVDEAVGAVLIFTTYKPKAIEPEKLETLSLNLNAILDKIVNMVAEWDDSLVSIAAEFADNAESVLGLISSAMESIEQLAGFRKGRFDIETMGYFMSDLGNILVQLVEFASSFEDMKLRLIETADFAGVAQAIVAMVTPTVEAVTALAQFKPGLISSDSFDAFARELVIVLRGLRGLAEHWVDEENKTIALSGVIDAVFQSIIPALDAILALGHYRPTGKEEANWGRTEGVIMFILNRLKGIADELEQDAYFNAVAFAESAEKVLALVVPAVEAVTALAGWENPVAIGRKWLYVEDAIFFIVNRIRDIVGTLETDAYSGAIAFSEAARAVLDMIGNAIGVIVDLGKFEKVGDIEFRMMDFMQNLQYVMTAIKWLASQFGQTADEIQDELGNIVTIAPYVEGAMNVIRPVLDALLGLADWQPLDTIKQQIDTFVLHMDMLLLALTNYAGRWAQTSKAAEKVFDLFPAMAGDIEQAVGVIKPVIDALKGLAEWEPVEGIVRLIDAFIIQMDFLVVALRDYADAWGDTVAEVETVFDLFPAMAGDITAAVAVVAPVLEAIKALTEWTPITSIQTRIDFFINLLDQLIVSLTAYAYSWGQTVEAAQEALAMAAAISEPISKALAIIQPAINAINQVMGFAIWAGFDKRLASLMANLKLVLVEMTKLSADPAMAASVLKSVTDWSDLVNEIITRVRSAFDAIIAISGHRTFDITWPLKLFGDAVMAVINKVASLTNEVLARIGSARLFSDLIDELADAVGMAVSRLALISSLIGETGALQVTTLANAIGNLGDTVGGALKDVATAIRNYGYAWGDVWGIIQETSGAAITDVVDGISAMTGGMQSILAFLSYTFVPGWKSAWTEIANTIRVATGQLQQFLYVMANAQVPSWLKGASPPPMANWLQQIADSAGLASLRLAGMGQSMPATPQQIINSASNTTVNNSHTVSFGDVHINNGMDQAGLEALVRRGTRDSMRTSR